jgi:hypothetical protein
MMVRRCLAVERVAGLLATALLVRISLNILNVVYFVGLDWI